MLEERRPYLGEIPDEHCVRRDKLLRDNFNAEAIRSGRVRAAMKQIETVLFAAASTLPLNPIMSGQKGTNCKAEWRQ